MKQLIIKFSLTYRLVIYCTDIIGLLSTSLWEFSLKGSSWNCGLAHVGATQDWLTSIGGVVSINWSPLVEWPTSTDGSWMEVAPKKKIMKQYLVFKKL